MVSGLKTLTPLVWLMFFQLFCAFYYYYLPSDGTNAHTHYGFLHYGFLP